MSLLSFQYVKSQIKSPIERVEAAVLFYKLNYEGFGRQLNLEVYNKEIIFKTSFEFRCEFLKVGRIWI